MNVQFDERFATGENKVFIALTGDPQEIADKLRRMATDIERKGKPIQENSTSFKHECQIITPMWNGRRY